jgi:hypothetical protein
MCVSHVSKAQGTDEKDTPAKKAPSRKVVRLKCAMVVVYTHAQTRINSQFSPPFVAGVCCGKCRLYCQVETRLGHDCGGRNDAAGQPPLA